MAIKNSAPIWDIRMFELIDHVVRNNVKGISTNSEFIKAVGIPTLATLDQVKNGKQSFRHEHFFKACELFGVSMDWFYGFSNSMKVKLKDLSAEELITMALSLMRKKNRR